MYHLENVGEDFKSNEPRMYLAPQTRVSTWPAAQIRCGVGAICLAIPGCCGLCEIRKELNELVVNLRSRSDPRIGACCSMKSRRGSDRTEKGKEESNEEPRDDVGRPSAGKAV